MGIYINPPVDLYGPKAKESWLIRQFSDGKVVEVPHDSFYAMDYRDVPEDQVILILVDNGPFTALAVANTEDEFNYFKRELPKDSRPTWVVLADKARAMEYAH